VNEDLDTLKEIDAQKIKKALEYQVPIEVTTYTLPKSMEMYIHSVLSEFLTACHQNHMEQYLSFCLGELLTNAKKANTKRVYFKEKGLDINDEEQYAVGMETFKTDTLSDINHYLELQKKSGLYIKFLLQIRTDSSVRIEIRNNAKLTPTEKKRIQDKLDGVKQYKSIDEVLTSVMDQSEGAGLGIIIMILMLEKIGLSRENYQVMVSNGETVTRIFLPCDSSIQDGLNEIYKDYAKTINAFPILKDNYNQLQSILQNGCDKAKLVELFQKDAMLTFLLLSYANKGKSNQFKISAALDSISDDELKSLFPKESPRVVLVENAEYKEKLESAAKTAIFSYNIAKNLRDFSKAQKLKFDDEEFYVLGLLNNLGRLLISGLSKEQRSELDKIILDLETKMNIKGVYNSETNYSMFSYYLLSKSFASSEHLECLKKCSNWDVPSELDACEPCHVIAASNIMNYFEQKELEYYQINRYLLQAVGIESESQLNEFIAKINSIC